MLKEHEFIEDSKSNRENSNILQVLERTEDPNELCRTISLSSASTEGAQKSG